MSKNELLPRFSNIWRQIGDDHKVDFWNPHSILLALASDRTDQVPA